MITHRPQRLRGASYVGLQRYFATICTRERSTTFANPPIALNAIAQLRTIAVEQRFAIYAYCLMPDHLHFVVFGTTDDADFRSFVTRFKQATGFDYRRLTGEFLWQPGFHERILRNDEATESVVRYVLENPIRAGLARELGEYPYAGSDLYTIGQLIALWQDRHRPV